MGLLQDFFFAWRHLRHARGFAAAAVVVLGVGLAIATTAIAIVNSVMLRPLAVADPSTLVALRHVNSHGQIRPLPLTIVEQLQSGAAILRVPCAYLGGTLIPVEIGGIATHVSMEFVSGGCAETFGIHPAAGRLLNDLDAPLRGRGQAVAVISYRLSVRAFGTAQHAIGQRLRAEGVDLTIVGVLPEAFSGLQSDTGSDVAVPFNTVFPVPAGEIARASHIVARLQSATSLPATVGVLQDRWSDVVRDGSSDRPGVAESTTPILEPLASGFSLARERYRTLLVTAAGLAALLLLLSIINVAGMVLAHISARGEELSVRGALGAGIHRLARQLFFESVIIAVASSVFAAVVAWFTGPYLLSLLPAGTVPYAIDTKPDARLLALVLALSLGIAVVISIVPTLLAARGVHFDTLRSARTATTSAPLTERLFLAGQIASSLVLVIGAALLAQSFVNLSRVDGGTQVSGIYHARLLPRPGGYVNFAADVYYPELLRRLGEIQGVESVSTSRRFPTYVDESAGLTALARAFDSDPSDPQAILEVISPNFFKTLGIGIVRGRPFAEGDGTRGAQVAIISDSLSAALFENDEPLGASVYFGPPTNRRGFVVVGVAANISLGNLRSPAVPVLYRPSAQEPRLVVYPNLSLRSRLSIETLSPQVRRVVDELGREYLQSLTTLGDTRARSLTIDRLNATIAVALGAASIMLAFVSVYLLIHFNTVRRRREILLRMALGASPLSIWRRSVIDSLIVCAIGIALGLPAAFASMSLINASLYGVEQFDAVTLALTPALFLGLAVVASTIPIYRICTARSLQGVGER